MSSLKRIVLGVQYDGSPWQGWQTQLSRNTVQDQLQLALEKFTQTAIVTTCAGRTDAGVHALEQVVHFDVALERDTFSWVRGLNANLPPSIAVRWASDATRVMTDIVDLAHVDEAELAEHELTEQFHARFSARSRTYHYLLYNNPIRSPLLAGKAGWVFRPLDVARMQNAARYLVGTHDFSAFRSSQCQAKSPIKTMHEIRIAKRGDLIVFTLRAGAFLHHMVRNIVGSLIVIGSGKHEPAWMQEVLTSCERERAAPTFMPDGLYLAKVDYGPQWGLPQQDIALPW